MDRDDLATDVPHVAETAQPAYADSGGRRRARRLRAAAVGVPLALLAALVLRAALTTEPAQPRAGAHTVGGYPRRLDTQRTIRPLPDRPGPVSAVVSSDRMGGHLTPRTRSSGWFAVSETGYRWHIPSDVMGGGTPSLSRDGRLLGYLAAESGPYVVHELVTGRRVEFADIGRSTPETETTLPFDVLSFWPGLWSPDGRRVLLTGAAAGEDTGHGRWRPSALLLDVESGSTTALDRVVAGGTRQRTPVGWATSDRIVWTQENDDSPVPTLHAIETDLRGTELRRTELRSSDGRQISVSETDASVAPSGTQIAIHTDTVARTVRRFSLESGQELANHPIDRGDDYQGKCPLAWAGADVVVHTQRGDGIATAQRLSPTGVQTVSVMSPRVRARCVQWAGDAISGPGRGGSVFGTRTAAWTWYWRRWVLGVVLVGGLGWLVLWTRRRAARRRLPTAHG